MHVRPLRPTDVAPVASLLSAAFDVDPAYQRLFPGPERAAGLGDLFARNLRVHLPHACTWVGVDADVPVATVTLRPPGGIRIGALTLLRHGALPFVAAHGIAAFRRLLWLKDTYDALEREASEGAPHWFVHMMVVAPERQGTGLGTRLLGEVLARAEVVDSRSPTVLTTHLPQNVVFYERAGFGVRARRTITVPGAAPYDVWMMRREGSGGVNSASASCAGWALMRSVGSPRYAPASARNTASQLAPATRSPHRVISCLAAGPPSSCA